MKSSRAFGVFSALLFAATLFLGATLSAEPPPPTFTPGPLPTTLPTPPPGPTVVPTPVPTPTGTPTMPPAPPDLPVATGMYDTQTQLLGFLCQAPAPQSVHNEVQFTGFMYGYGKTAFEARRDATKKCKSASASLRDYFKADCTVRQGTKTAFTDTQIPYNPMIMGNNPTFDATCKQQADTTFICVFAYQWRSACCK